MNAYQLIKPILFRMDAEKAHQLTIRWLNWLYHFSPALLKNIANTGGVISGSESAKVFGFGSLGLWLSINIMSQLSLRKATIKM